MEGSNNIIYNYNNKYNNHENYHKFNKYHNNKDAMEGSNNIIYNYNNKYNNKNNNNIYRQSNHKSSNSVRNSKDYPRVPIWTRSKPRKSAHASCGKQNCSDYYIYHSGIMPGFGYSIFTVYALSLSQEASK